MNHSDLPESWQRDLQAQQQAAKQKPAAAEQKPTAAEPSPRAPIQPVFKLRFGFLAFLLPIAALFAAAGISFVLQADLPSWPAGVLFYAMLAGGNGMILSLAIGMEHSHTRFAGRCALFGMLSVLVFLIPGAAEVYLAFLILYLFTRAVSIAGIMSIFVFGLGIGLAIVFLAALNYAFQGAVRVALDSSSTRLAMGLVAACPLAHSLCTASLPAEKTIFGRLDAMLTGLAASLLGMFASLVVYRTLMAIIGLAAEFTLQPVTNLIQLGLAAGALAVGNWYCVRQLFRFAYSAREDRPLRPRKKGEHGPKLDRTTLDARISLPRVEKVRTAVDVEIDPDDAT